MQTLELEFENSDRPESRFRLQWQVLPNLPAFHWVKLLARIGHSRKLLYPRFTGFLSPQKSLASISAVLNSCIERINQEGLYSIPQRADGKFTQEFANEIHHHFELLRGRFEQPAEIYMRSSERVRRAILGLNHCIHDLESLSRAIEAQKSKATSAAALIFEGENLPRYKLPSEAESDFTMRIEYGDIFLHYGQIGKTWWEVFLDADKEIFPEAILPLNVLTGEFDICFYDFKPSADLLHRFHAFLIQQGQDPRHPALRLGYVPVAKLDRSTGLSPESLNHKIAQTLKVSCIQVFDRGQLIVDVPLQQSFFEEMSSV